MKKNLIIIEVIGIICLIFALDELFALPHLPTPQKTNAASSPIQAEKPLINFKVFGLDHKDKIRENIEKKLMSQERRFRDYLTPDYYQTFCQLMPPQIAEAIKPYGYFRSQISMQLVREKNNLSCQAYISLGAPVRIRHINFQITGPGNQLEIFQRFYHALPLKTGDILDTTIYEDIKQDLLDTAAAHGYFKSQMLENKILLDLSKNQGDIILHFDTGPPYFFGNTTFSPTPLKESFLQRFLTYQPGEAYNSEKINKTRTGLANSNYFHSVIVAPDLSLPKNYLVPVDIKLHTQASQQYTVGAGYGTDTGPRVLFDSEFRRLNSSGHHANVFVRGSLNESAVIAKYYIPGFYPPEDQYIFTTGYLNINENIGKANSVMASAGYQTVLLGWQTTLALTLLNEEYNLNFEKLPNTHAHLLFPNLTFQRKSTDNFFHPQQGYIIQSRFAGASEDVLSKTSYLQGRIDSKFLFTLWDNLRVIPSASIGYTDIKNILNLPLSQQFLLGGAQNLRGFSYNSVGPGKSLVFGSLEFQQRIYKSWYLAIFVDSGNVSNRIFKDKLKTDIGPGIAWVSPIGTFELTIANAISQPNRPWVIQFSMGPEL